MNVAEEKKLLLKAREMEVLDRRQGWFMAREEYLGSVDVVSVSEYNKYFNVSLLDWARVYGDIQKVMNSDFLSF